MVKCIPPKARMKRKNESPEGPDAQNQAGVKKRALSDETLKARFRDGLFDDAVLKQYTDSYAKSAP